MTIVFSVGQYYLERYYARGSSRSLPPTPLQKIKVQPILPAAGGPHDRRESRRRASDRRW